MSVPIDFGLKQGNLMNQAEASAAFSLAFHYKNPSKDPSTD